MADRDTMMDEMLDSTADETTVDTTDTSTEVELDLSQAAPESTIDDLKKLPGAAKHSDEELEQMWQAAKAPKAPARSYKLFKDDAEINDFTNLKPEDILNLTFGYQAMGKEQRRSLEQIIRNAQLGHYNESRMQQLLGERNSVVEKLKAAEEKLSGYGNDRQMMDYVLNQYLQGNTQPFEKLLQSVQQVAQQMPQMEQPQSNPAEVEAAGQRVYYEVVVPNAYQLAQEYGANAQEIANAIVQMVNQEPEEFLTPQRYQSIIQYELPALLERNGYSKGRKPVAKDDPVAALTKQVAELQAQLKNSTVEKAKQKKAPPAGGGQTPSAGEETAAITDRKSMKKFLRG